MLAGDVAMLDELCSDDLIYTQSNADSTTSGAICTTSAPATSYLEITHPADRSRWRRARHRADDRQGLSVAGRIVHVDNRAVWVREQGAWKFVAYQPTPIIRG